MSPSRPLLIFLLLFLNPALGFPVAKRLSHSEISEDVLAGTDFLSVFMKTSPARSVAPSFKYSSIFGAKARNSDYSETNSVVQKSKEDIHLYSDINLKGEDALESDSHEAVDHQEPLEEETNKANSQVNTYIEDTMTVTDKNITDSTTSSPTTTAINDDTLASTYYDLEEEHPSIVQGFRDDRSTKPTVTQYWSETQPYSQPPTYSPVSTNSSDQAPLQVISVRVSSSVVRHSHKVDDALKGFESEKVNKPVVSTLVTQEQPTNTAIQRSHLNVEEATLPEDQSSYQHEDEPIVKIQPSLSISNTDSYQYSSLSNKPISSENNIPKVYNRETNQDENSRIVKNAPVDEHHSEAEDEERKIQQTDFLKLPQNQNQTRAQKESLGSYIKEETDERRNDYSVESTKSQNTQNEPQALPYQYKYRSYSHQPSPIPDYQSRSYLKEENYEKKEDFTEENPQPEVNRDQPQALAFQYNPQNHHLSPISYHTSVSSATSGSRVQFYRGPPSYRRGSVAESVQRAVLADPKSEFPYPGPTPPKPVHQPEPVEKSYELPEQNYEVDESISVVTNGRAHGVQIPTPIPTVESSKNEKDDENKSGYVVEGRNFRKYRVEERTSDGFIVGEYGVVSHDDGSLRGVRYTADGTINPRLIYDALVKFLSLK